MFISENKFSERKTLLQNTKSDFGLKINSKIIDLGQGLNGIHYTFKKLRKQHALYDDYKQNRAHLTNII